MTLEQLRTLVAVVETQSFTEAARRLGLSQPAVSQHVQSLEKSLGQRLIDRSHRKLQLTVAGQRVLAFARQFLQQRESLELELASLDSELQGIITIGAINTVGIHTLPRLVTEFRQQTPSVQVRLSIGNTEQIIDAMTNGSIELAVLDTNAPIDEPRPFRIDPFIEEHMVLALPPDHPWAGRESLEAGELYSTPLILRALGSRGRYQIEAELTKAGIDPGRLNVGLELDNYEAIKQAVCEGLGVGFMPLSITKRERQWGVLTTVELANAPLRRPIWLHSPLRNNLPERIPVMRDFLLQRSQLLPTHD